MGLPTTVDNDECLVSYILESSKFKADGIDHRQFMPSNRYGNTSVFRKNGLTEDETAAVGHKEVALPRLKPGILGWAELLARVVRAASPLSVISSEPPERHALIEGWPKTQKEVQRTLALLLASKARVVKKSTIPL